MTAQRKADVIAMARAVVTARAAVTQAEVALIRKREELRQIEAELDAMIGIDPSRPPMDSRALIAARIAERKIARMAKRKVQR